jgi:predicted transcriptional regulator
MDMEAGKTLTNEEVIRELLDLLKKNAMKEQANDVFEICSYVDGLEKKIDSMTEELTNMQNQIKKMQEDTLVNNAKKALSEARERLNARSEQIKSQLSEVKAQVKSTAKSIVDEAKAKGRAALYRVSEFLGIKKRLLDIRENVRGAIKTTDKDIAKTALLAKGFREAGQTAANAFRTFADKPEVDYSKKEQKHPITKVVIAPMKAVKKILVSMELHLDASIDKLDNLAMNVQLDKEKHMESENAQAQTAKEDIEKIEPIENKAEKVEAEIVYAPMVAESHEYQYNAEAFEAIDGADMKVEAAKEVPMVRTDKAR